MKRSKAAPSPDRAVEEALVRAFAVPPKRKRLLGLLSNPRRRGTILETLYHFKDLDPRSAVAIPGSQQSRAAIEALLRTRGAPEECYVISTNRTLDAKRMPLRDALEAIVGMGDGSLISCVPGRLGYFEGEDLSDRWLLERR